LNKRGESRTYQQDNLTISVWQDNRPVVLISTCSDPTTTNSVLRKGRDGTTATYSCPNSLALYNQHMGGVDRNDQLRGYYHVRLKCRKYYKYIFWEVVGFCLLCSCFFLQLSTFPRFIYLAITYTFPLQLMYLTISAIAL